MSLWFGQGGSGKLRPCVTGCREALSDPHVEDVEVGSEDAEEDSWEFGEVEEEPIISTLHMRHVEHIVDIDAPSFIVDIDGCAERRAPDADQHLQIWSDHKEEIYDFDEMHEPTQSCAEREDSLFALVNELSAPMQAEGAQSCSDQKEKVVEVVEVGKEESWAPQAEEADHPGEEEDEPEQQDRFESEEEDRGEEAVLSMREDVTLASANAAEVSSEQEGRSPPAAAEGFDWILGSPSRVSTPPTEAVKHVISPLPAGQSNPFLSMKKLDFSSIPDNFTQEPAIGEMSPASKEACERAEERQRRSSAVKCLQDTQQVQCIEGVYGQLPEKLKRELSYISEGEEATTDEAWSTDDEDIMWPTTDSIDFDASMEEDAEEHMEKQLQTETKIQEEVQDHSAQPHFSSLSHTTVLDSLLSDEEVLARFPVSTPAAAFDSCGCLQGLLKLGGPLTPRGTSKSSENEHEAPVKSASPDSSSSTDLSIDEDELKSMLSQSRADLVTLCQCRGLPSNGSKSDLAHRLSSVVQ